MAHSTKTHEFQNMEPRQSRPIIDGSINSYHAKMPQSRVWERTSVLLAVALLCGQPGMFGGRAAAQSVGCSVLPGSTVDATFVNVSTIQATNLMRQAKAPLRRYTGVVPVLAPITPHPDGSGYLLWTSTAGQAKLTRIDPTGKPGDVSTDEDLGPAFATGALATNGETIGYLLRSSEHKLEFRVKGGATTVIMDNDVPAGDQPNVLFSGRGIRFNDVKGQPAGGTQAMYYPMEMHRGSVLFGGGKWFASFDHYNNFNAYSNPAVPYGHTGAALTYFNGDGSAPTLGFGWGTSHSMDMRNLFDGERIINIHLGDAYPMDLEMRVTYAATGQVGQRNYLFGKSKFPDTVIGADKNGVQLYGIAGNGGGLTAGKLGDLVQTGCGRYALTYTIEPQSLTFFDGTVYTSTPNELGFLVLDKGANIVTRTKLRSASDVETVKSARWGKSAILVAWKTKGAEEYWMMVVDGSGNVLQNAQRLPAGVTFGAADTLTMMKNGDIMWTTSDAQGNLKLFRLPAPFVIAPTSVGDRISSGTSYGSLQQNQMLVSSNGKYQAVLQNDGNFVIYSQNGPLWHTQTPAVGTPTYMLAMQADSNLVLYATSGPTWFSGIRSGMAPYTLIMQDDGNLVIYDKSSQAIWASWTQQ